MIDAAQGRVWQDGLRAKMDRKLKMLSAQDFLLNNCTVSGLILTWRLPIACFLL